MEIRIWLGDLGAYNAGSLVGEWLSLPMDAEELAAKVAKYSHDGTQDYFIADWEYPSAFNNLVSEHSNPIALNETAERLAELSKYDLARVGYLVSAGQDVSDALDNYEDVTFYEGQSLKDVAYQLVDDGLFGDIPKDIASYIDYDAIARDLQHDGYDETPTGVFEYRG
jgi:antirestriction protein